VSGILSRIARRFRPPRRLRITREGKAFLVVTLGVGAAAINTGNNLLYLALSVNLSLIVLSGILSELTLRRVSLAVRPASEAFAGREAFLAVSCCAAGARFPGLSLRASLRIPGETVTVRFPDFPPGGTATRVVPFHPIRRGRVGTISAATYTRFPFSLFEKSADREIGTELVVYPVPAPSGGWDPGSPESSPEETPHRAGRTGAFPRGAREHLPADPVRDIHWKASARAGRWMVKEREGESARAVDLRVAVPSRAGRFEEELSGACGAVLALEGKGVPYRLWIGDRLVADAHARERRLLALSALATAREDGTFDGEAGA
jgi:uncharacterized protein (DUF58 family)